MLHLWSFLDGLMKTSLPANGTHTFLPETSTSASMNVPTQYSHLTQDHRSKSWRYEQVMQSMNLTKSPKSQDQATQVDNGTPKAVSSESAATGGHSNTRMFQSPIAVHQTRPLVSHCSASIVMCCFLTGSVCLYCTTYLAWFQSFIYVQWNVLTS